MSLADDLKPLARGIRGIPGQLGLRPHRVFLVTGLWSGGEVGKGHFVPDELELLEGDSAGAYPPKVRQLNDERLALANLASGSLEIGPITTNAVTANALRGVDLFDKQTLHVRVQGPTGTVRYRIAKAKLDRAIHWILTVEPFGNVAQ